MLVRIGKGALEVAICSGWRTERSLSCNWAIKCRRVEKAINGIQLTLFEDNNPSLKKEKKAKEGKEPSGKVLGSSIQSPLKNHSCPKPTQPSQSDVACSILLCCAAATAAAARQPFTLNTYSTLQILQHVSYHNETSYRTNNSSRGYLGSCPVMLKKWNRKWKWKIKPLPIVKGNTCYW